MLHLSSLSQTEAFYKHENSPFVLGFEAIAAHTRTAKPVTKLYTRTFTGDMPAIVSGQYISITPLISNGTYALSDTDSLSFIRLMKAAAARTAQCRILHGIAISIRSWPRNGCGYYKRWVLCSICTHTHIIL